MKEGDDSLLWDRGTGSHRLFDLLLPQAGTALFGLARAAFLCPFPPCLWSVVSKCLK